MFSKQYLRVIGAAVLGIGIIALILFRNTPQFVEQAPAASGIGAPAFPAKPPVMDLPSASNVVPGFSERIDELRRSAEQHPKNAAHLIALAQLLMDGHRAKDAIMYYEKAALLQPKNDSLLLDLSVCYFNEKQYDKALQTTERILRFEADNSHALYNKGAILATIGRKKEAAAVWKDLLKRRPDSEEAKTVRGHLSMLEK